MVAGDTVLCVLGYDSFLLGSLDTSLGNCAKACRNRFSVVVRRQIALSLLSNLISNPCHVFHRIYEVLWLILQLN